MSRTPRGKAHNEDAAQRGLLAQALERFFPPCRFQATGKLQPASFQVAEIFAQLGISLPVSLPCAMISMPVAVQRLVVEGFFIDGFGTVTKRLSTQCCVTKRCITSYCVAEFWKHCLTSARNPMNRYDG